MYVTFKGKDGTYVPMIRGLLFFRLELESWGVGVSVVEPSGFKTSLYQNSSLPSTFRTAWDRSPPSVKEDYGQNYYEEGTGCSVVYVIPL